ncbi:MAG: hypothetical protein PHO02_06090 [Candidatus Nanoarchaeia archaeon]|nr:hypothetical protein [Candidatus Nanoarchaeia archaeon]
MSLLREVMNQSNDFDITNFEDRRFYSSDYQNECSLCGKKLYPKEYQKQYNLYLKRLEWIKQKQDYWSKKYPAESNFSKNITMLKLKLLRGISSIIKSLSDFGMIKKIGLFNYCDYCNSFIFESYRDINLSLLYKFYFVFWNGYSRDFNEHILLSEYSREELVGYPPTSFNEEFLKNCSISIKQKIILIKFKNYKVDYTPDYRLTLENQLIKKRQSLNSAVFYDFHTILLSLESLPLWSYNAYGRSFFGTNCSNPSTKIDPSLLKYKEVIVEYEGVGINNKGNDVPILIARVKLNLSHLKSKNIANILEKDRWDLFYELIEFEFNKFPSGADGFKGYKGDIEN